MARLVSHAVSPPDACSYLPDREAVLESRVMVDVTPSELEHLLARGWRRFGPHYFRPVCAGCTECVSLRVVVDEFRPSRRHRRVLSAARHVRERWSTPVLDEERLGLYRRWHAEREVARGWREDQTDEEGYALQFCYPHPSAREVTYWEGDDLVAVAITDETPDALSLVFCFYEPSRAELSLGTLNVLRSLARARELEKTHVYLGFRVAGCPSLRYKGRFFPHELLVGRPALGEAPTWRRVEGDAAGD